MPSPTIDEALAQQQPVQNQSLAAPNLNQKNLLTLPVHAAQGLASGIVNSPTLQSIARPFAQAVRGDGPKNIFTLPLAAGGAVARAVAPGSAPHVPQAASEAEIQNAMNGQGVPGTETPRQPYSSPNQVDPASLQFAQPQGQQQGAPVPRPQYVGAQYINTAGPENQRAEDAGFRAERDAVQGQERIAQAGNNAVAKAEDAQALAHRLDADQRRVNADDFLATNQKAQEEGDAAAARRNAIAANVAQDYAKTPDQIWHSTSTFDKVLYTISDALSGFAEGFGHLAPSVGAIQRHINGEVEAAAKNHEMHKEQLGQANDVYSQIMKRVHSPEEAKQIYYGMLNDSTQATIQEKATLSGSASAQAKGALMIGGLQRDDAQIQEQQAQNRAHNTHYVAPHLAGGGSGLLGRVDDKGRALIYTDPNTGKKYIASDADQKKKAVETLQGEQELESGIHAYKDATKKVGFWDKATHALSGGLYTSPELAEAIGAHKVVQSATRKNFEGGVYKQGEQSLLDQQIKDPTSLFTNEKLTDAQEQVLSDTSRNAVNATLAGDSPLEVKTGFAVDPKTGRVGPVAQYTGEEYRPPPPKFKPKTLKP